MVFLEERIRRILEELKLYCLPESQAIKSYKCKKTEELGFESADPSALDWEDFDTEHEWGGHREFYWFITDVVVPQSFDGKCVTFNLTTGREGSWDATNPQFRAFVNGKIQQGLDVNHRSMQLTECARAGDRYRIALRAFTGDNNSHLLLKSDISILDKAVEKLYYDILVPFEVASLIDKEEKTHIDTILSLNETVNLLDLRVAFSPEFHESVKAAQEYIDKEFYDKQCGRSEAEVWCVGHTHIDVAWLWTLAITRDKAFRSFSTVLDLMKQYPEYKFMSSQPQLYQYVKEQSPELFEEIKARVKEGRWEPEGGMWLEADCNIASGEALVRQILFGKRFFREEFDADNKILWLPDVFGYSAALPQILRKSDMPYFMTTKISWNDTNKLPYDTFHWRGIDGSEVLTHFIPSMDYNSPRFFTTYNGTINASQIKGAWQRYQQKNINNKVMMSFGFGDGGGGPTKEHLEHQRRLAKGIPGAPKTVMATSREFFDTLHSEVEGNKYLPTWSGELYLEFHRGTYTTMARNKKFNRKSEFMLQNAELYSVMGRKFAGEEYPRQRINDDWRVLLRNQFHDILPGSSIKEVYDDSKAEYEGIIADGSSLIGGKLSSVAAKVASDGASIVVFNPNGFELSDIVTFELPQGIKNPAVYDGGRQLACQVIEGGKAVFVALGVPSKGYKSFALKEGCRDCDTKAGASPVEISAKGFSNTFFQVELDDKAQFVSVYDKRAGRQLLKEGEKANVLTAYEDKPFEYDAWNIEMYYKEKGWRVDDVQSVEVVESGAVRSCLKITRKFLSSTIEQYVYVYATLPRIDVKNHIDWKEKQILLRASFPVDIHAEEATYEIQYGNVTRPAHFNTSWDMARFEVCTHKWADFSEDDYGVSLLNDCKYGYDIHDGVVSISLLKSALYPNPDADKEEHEFTYALYPHQGGWKSAGTVQQAYAINNPLTAVVKAQAGGTLPASCSFASCDAQNVVIEVVKQAEDSDELIIRLYECYNRRTTATVTLPAAVSKAVECNLLERELEPVKTNGSSITFEIKPFEIKTFKIAF